MVPLATRLQQFFLTKTSFEMDCPSLHFKSMEDICSTDLKSGSDTIVKRNIFAQNLAKKWRFLLKLLLVLQKIDHNNDFERKVNFLPKIGKNRRKQRNWREPKSGKIIQRFSTLCHRYGSTWSDWQGGTGGDPNLGELLPGENIVTVEVTRQTTLEVT
jgi:hypothetical protein